MDTSYSAPADLGFAALWSVSVILIGSISDSLQATIKDSRNEKVSDENSGVDSIMGQ